MKKFFALLLLAVCVSVGTLCANDSMYYTSGTQLVPLQATDISLQKEVLTINILPDGTASIDVQYVLYNPGAKRTITMGFEADPPYMGEGYRADGIHPYVNDFSVEINGNKTPFRNAVVRLGCIEQEQKIQAFNTQQWTTNFPNNDEGYDMQSVLYNAELDSAADYAYAYYFEATFLPGRNTIHHTYRYQMDDSVDSHYGINYKLTPALRWANKQIDDFTLIISGGNSVRMFFLNNSAFGSPNPSFTIAGTGLQRTFDRPDYDYEEGEAKETGRVYYTAFSLRGATVTFHQTNFQPAAELHIQSADAYEMVHNEVEYDGTEQKWRDNNALLVANYYDSDYGCKSLFALGGVEDSLTDRFNFFLPDGDYIDADRILRNMPFAARGYVFKNKDLQSFFSHCWWYMPDPSYVADFDKLNPKEREFIKEVDKSKH